MDKNHTHQLCINNSLQLIKKWCLHEDIKLTEIHIIILNLILQSHTSQKAYDILDHLKVTHKSAKPTTVYRALNFLLAKKLIHKIESSNSFLACSHPGEDHNCCFVICIKCKEVHEVCQNKILSGVYQYLDIIKFVPSDVTLEIKGVCNSCSS